MGRTDHTPTHACGRGDRPHTCVRPRRHLLRLTCVPANGRSRLARYILAGFLGVEALEDEDEDEEEDAEEQEEAAEAEAAEDQRDGDGAIAGARRKRAAKRARDEPAGGD